jgi:hypothetical protein
MEAYKYRLTELGIRNPMTTEDAQLLCDDLPEQIQILGLIEA